MDQRHELELRAAAALEMRRRRAKEKTVYGFYSPSKGGPKLVRCWQEQNGEYVQVNSPPFISLPLKLEPAVLIKKPIKVIKGGRGSGKSESVSKIAGARVKDYGLKICAFREFQNSISDSVHSIISRQINEHAWPGFECLESKINHDNGGKIRYRGLARNPDGVKSFDGFNMFWGEEAQTTSAKSLELLEPTIRESDAEIWYTMNPGSSADPISIEHLNPYESELLANGYYEDDHVMVIEINYQDNPWFPDRLESQRKKNKSLWAPSKYNNVWGGEFNDSVDNAITQKDWVDACVDAHVKLGFKPRGAKIAAFDPNDGGDDPAALVIRHGSVYTFAEEKNGLEVNDGCDWALDVAINELCDLFVWDADGLGLGLRRQISDNLKGKKIDWFEFHGNDSVQNPNDIYMPTSDDDDPWKRRKNSDVFRNLRAQKYFDMRDCIYRTYRAVIFGEYCNPDEMVSFSGDMAAINKFKIELCRIPQKPNGSGLKQIMTKLEMKTKYGIDSPNLADSGMMTRITPMIRKKKVTANPIPVVNRF